MLPDEMWLFLDVNRFRGQARGSVQYLTGIMQKLGLMRIEIFLFLGSIQTNVLSPNHLLFIRERNPAVSLQILYAMENQDKVSPTPTLT